MALSGTHVFSQVDYTVRDIGTLSGFTSSYGFDVNDEGTVVGAAGTDTVFYPDCAPETLFQSHQGFVSKNGTCTALPIPAGFRASHGIKINNAGAVAGFASFISNSSFLTMPFLFSGNQSRELLSGAAINDPTSLSLYGKAIAINNAGRIGGAGQASSSTNSYWSSLAFLSENGRTSGLVLPEWRVFSGGEGYQVRGINQRGELLVVIAGKIYKLSSSMKTALGAPASLKRSHLEPTLVTDIGLPTSGIRTLHVFGLNDSGETVGWFYAPNFNDNKWTSFLYSNGRFSEVPSLESGQNVFPFDLNNAGQIVGWAVAAGKVRAFCATASASYDLNLALPALVPGTGGFRELLAAFGINELGQITGVGRWVAGNGTESLRGFLLTPDRSAQPIFSPNGATFVGGGTFGIMTPSPGGSIYYSVDGSYPNRLYTQRIVLKTSAQVKALVRRPGLPDSAVAVAQFEVLPPTQSVPVPTISPEGGVFYDQVQVHLLASDPGASLAYTLDGSDPAQIEVPASGYAFRNVFITSSAQLRVASSKLGFGNSEASASFEIRKSPVLDTPQISPSGRTFTGSVVVEILSDAPDSEVRYTLNGRDPTYESFANVYRGPFIVNGNVTVSAAAFPINYVPGAPIKSSVAVAEFRTSARALYPPAILPMGGSFTGSPIVTLVSDPIGTPIDYYYTLDGTLPTRSSPRYVGPLTLSKSALLRARAFASGWNDSDVAESRFEVAPGQTMAAPTLSPSGGTFRRQVNVTVTPPIAGVDLRYTLDGTDPTPSSPAVVGTLTFKRSCQVKIRAFMSGYEPSPIANGSYVVRRKRR